MLFKALLSVALLVGSFSAVAGPTSSRAEREVQSRNIKQWLSALVLHQPYKSLESLNLRVENFVDHDATLEHYFYRVLRAQLYDIQQTNPQSEFNEQKSLWQSLKLRDEKIAEKTSGRLSDNSRFLISSTADQMLTLAQIQLALTIISDHLLLKDPTSHTALILRIRTAADAASKKISATIDERLLLLATATPKERLAISNDISNLAENFWLLHFKTLGATTSEIASLDILADMNNNLPLRTNNQAIAYAIKKGHERQVFDIQEYISMMGSSHSAIRGVIYSSLLFFTFIGAQNIPVVIPGIEATIDSFVGSLQPYSAQVQIAAAQAGTTIDILLKTHFTNIHSFFTSAGFQKLVHDTLYSSAEGLKLQGHENQLFWATLLGMGSAGLEKLRSLPTRISQHLELSGKQRQLSKYDQNPSAVSETFNKLVTSITTTYEKFKAKQADVQVEECEEKLAPESKPAATEAFHK